MIIQTTLTRDECFLIKQLLPIWKKYVDGFIFMVDSRTTDDTREYLQNNKELFNILEIIEHNFAESPPHESETYGRQKMFDTAYKYSNKIICLDTDEYIDGVLNKQELEEILDFETNTVFLLKWVQYTNKNEIRIDGPWKNNFKDRIGVYSCDVKFTKKASHSSHLPDLQKSNNSKISEKYFDPNKLFIAHLQWLDKKTVGVKQYYWKVWDYVQHKLHEVNIIDRNEYDKSINNFIWENIIFEYPLKVEEDIFKKQNIKENTKLKFIVDQTQIYNIPNLGDWGMGIYDYAINSKK